VDNKPPDDDRRLRAVALRYDAEKSNAPRVVAKGSGRLAERIRELAEEHGVAIHEDPNLVEALAQLDLDRDIPEDLYRAVAEVLAFVYQMNQRMAPK
jgi:flagellar biosynthesis protein